MGKASVYTLYVHARERISRFNLYDLNQKKFGGPGEEVMVDILKMG